MKRSKLIPMLVVFDAPDGTVGVGDRPTTTVAPQALLLMNNPQVRSWARALRRGASPTAKTAEEAIRPAYRLALSRDATADELADGRGLRRRQEASYAGKTDARRDGPGRLLPGADVPERVHVRGVNRVRHPQALRPAAARLRLPPRQFLARAGTGSACSPSGRCSARGGPAPRRGRRSLNPLAPRKPHFPAKAKRSSGCS